MPRAEAIGVVANASGRTFLARLLTPLGRLDKARAAAQAGLPLDQNFTIRRFRFYAASDNPTYLAGRERAYKLHENGRGTGRVGDCASQPSKGRFDRALGSRL